MRPTRIMLIAGLALAMAVPASASPGYCVDDSASGVDRCAPPLITCQRGDSVTVVVTGYGAGIARCGDGNAFCNGVGGCFGSDPVTFGGTLSCDVDQFGNFEATAYCTVTTTVDN